MSELKQDIRAIFWKAIQFPTSREMDRYLDDACGNSSELRAEVAELIESHRRAGSFLGGDVADDGGMTETPSNDHLGTVIGCYTIREQIGEGGMGEVYVAEQSAPVRRKVALKIIRPGMATKDVVARFEAERQGAGDDGPSEHRQSVRRRRNRDQAAVLRDGAGAGRSDYGVLRPSAS